MNFSSNFNTLNFNENISRGVERKIYTVGNLLPRMKFISNEIVG